MSLEAITWALAQPISHSSAKFILVVLSNCANAESMEAYPSTTYLAEATGQDRKTVLANLGRLREWGFIEPTGSKKGTTGQVIVYRLKSPEIGTVEQSQKRNSTENGTVPFLDGNSPVFPSKQSRFSAKQSQKRDTEPSETSGKRRSNQKSAHTHALDCPSDVDPQTWSDWLALRKAKRAPVTETVVRGARGEAKKAGMTITAFLEVWCQRGSQGLQAEWLKPNERAGPRSGKPAVNASFENENYTGTPADELFDQFPAAH